MFFIGFLPFAYLIFINGIVESKNCTQTKCENGKSYCASQLRRMNFTNIMNDSHLYYCKNGRALYHTTCGKAACVENLPQQPYCACIPGQQYCGGNLQLMKWNASVYSNDVLYQCDSPNTAAVVKKCTGAFCKFSGQSSNCVQNMAKCATGYSYCGYELSEMMYNGTDANTLYRCNSKLGPDLAEACENGCVYGSDNSFCSRTDKVGRAVDKNVQRSAQVSLQEILQPASDVNEADHEETNDTQLYPGTDIRMGPKTVPPSFVIVGDMVMTKDKYNTIFKKTGRYTTIALDDRWPKGVVVYSFDKVFSTSDRKIIKDALRVIENTTCLRFYERTTENNYIKLIDDGAGYCWSDYGMQGGMQELSLGSGCVYEDTIIHEFLHAVGFLHEQMRPDRNEYITVMWDNIADGAKSQYDIRGNDTQSNMSYSYDSVMHYESWGFRKADGLKTMIAKDPQYQPVLDDKVHHKYNKCDVERVNVLYNCASLITLDCDCYKI